MISNVYSIRVDLWLLLLMSAFDTERFFRSLKSERLVSCRFATRRSAEIEVLDYITYYNFARLHSTLGYQSPMEYEKEQFLKVA